MVGFNSNQQSQNVLTVLLQDAASFEIFLDLKG